jgi:hypothetical protein
MTCEPDRHDEKTEMKGVTDDRVERLLHNGLVKRQEKTTEDGDGKSPSPLISFRAGQDPDPEEDKPGTHSDEKEQKDDPEQRAF